MTPRRSLITALTVITALAMLLSGSLGSGIASAHAASSQERAEALTLNIPGPEVAATLATGSSGLAATVSGHDFYWNKTGSGMVLSVDAPAGDQPVTDGFWDRFCAPAFASIVFGVGAGVLAAAAATGAPLVIGGYFLTAAQLGVLAGIATSFGALEAWAAINIC